MDKAKKLLQGKKLLIFIGLITVILVIWYLPEIWKLTLSIDEFRDFILSTGKLGPLIFVLFQILQTVIAPIPGEVIQIAGGFIYGGTLGTIYTTVGMLLGAMIAFYFTRFLGAEFIENLLKKDKFKWMRDILEHKNFSIFLFIMFVIPGLPKDLFIYAAALTRIKSINFFVILLVARLPWLIASVSIGSNIYQKDYVTTIVITVVSVVAFILGLIYKDKLINKLASFKKGN